MCTMLVVRKNVCYTIVEFNKYTKHDVHNVYGIPTAQDQYNT